MERNIRYILILILSVLFIHFSKAQTDTVRGTYVPWGKKTPARHSDTVVKVKVIKQKPPGTLGKILYYLSPTKYELLDSVYPMYTENDPFYLHEKNHSFQFEANKGDSAYSEKYWDKKYHLDTKPIRYKKDTTIYLKRMVYGYHPYWMGSAYQNYNYYLLSRIAYFSYVVDPRTGNAQNNHFWEKTEMIDLAHKANCKVDLCISNFGGANNTTFLTNKTAQTNLITTVLNLLKKRAGDGINVNFEAVPKANSDDYSEFIKNLSKELKKANPNYKLTITLPAIDWRNAYNVAVLKDFVDYFFLMGYDFYGKYSTVAGPNSLLFSGSSWSENNVNTTIDYYIKFGAPPESLILGLPYYGNEWITKDGQIPSKAVKFNGARSYSYIANNYADKYIARYDSTSHCIYYVFRDSVNWVQVWTDNVQTLGMKYDYINEKRLGGVGVWALGYDNTYTELWDLIKMKFTAPVDTNPDLHSRLSKTLEYSVTHKAVTTIRKTDPDYSKRFNDKLNTGWKIFALLMSIFILFAFIGFVIAVADYDVRFVLFNKEVRTYLFFILITILALLIFRILNMLQNSDLILIIAIIFGISAALILLKVGKTKQIESGGEKP